MLPYERLRQVRTGKYQRPLRTKVSVAWFMVLPVLALVLACSIGFLVLNAQANRKKAAIEAIEAEALERTIRIRREESQRTYEKQMLDIEISRRMLRARTPEEKYQARLFAIRGRDPTPEEKRAEKEQRAAEEDRRVEEMRTPEERRAAKERRAAEERRAQEGIR